MAENFDVVIIGGGPGGASSALLLDQFGYKVCLVEKDDFPRFHIGESLLSMSLPLLRELNFLSVIESAGFLKKYGSVFIWGEPSRIINLGMPGHGYAWQVDRAKFDQLLLEECKKKVTVLRGKVKEVSQTTITVASPADRVLELRSPFVIDASGHARHVARTFGVEVIRHGYKRKAIFTRFSGCRLLEGQQSSHIVTEVTQDGWLWFIPLDSHGAASVGFVSTSRHITSKNLKSELLTQIKSSHLIQSLVPVNPCMIEPVRTQSYWNSIVSRPVINKRFFLSGDSLMFVDPLFSTGVHSSFFSGTLAARCIDATLSNGLDIGDVVRFYERKVRDYYNRTRSMIALLYSFGGETAPFWRLWKDHNDGIT